jgi:hypothetical protein
MDVLIPLKAQLIFYLKNLLLKEDLASNTSAEMVKDGRL